MPIPVQEISFKSDKKDDIFKDVPDVNLPYIPLKCLERRGNVKRSTFLDIIRVNENKMSVKLDNLHDIFFTKERKKIQQDKNHEFDMEMAKRAIYMDNIEIKSFLDAPVIKSVKINMGGGEYLTVNVKNQRSITIPFKYFFMLSVFTSVNLDIFFETNIGELEQVVREKVKITADFYFERGNFYDENATYISCFPFYDERFLYMNGSIVKHTVFDDHENEMDVYDKVKKLKFNIVEKITVRKDISETRKAIQIRCHKIDESKLEVEEEWGMIRNPMMLLSNPPVHTYYYNLEYEDEVLKELSKNGYHGNVKNLTVNDYTDEQKEECIKLTHKLLQEKLDLYMTIVMDN